LGDDRGPGGNRSKARHGQHSANRFA
jgi:hypothetical protein